MKTPWYDYEIPFTKEAEIGTQKVIHDHATIGFVVTTDGKCDRSAKRKLCGSRRADSERTSTDREAISYFIKLPETVFERDRTFEISS